MKRGLLLIAILIAGSLACSDKIEQEDETVLAKVNGEALTFGDIAYQVPPDQRGNITDDYLRGAIESWINTEVAYQKAVEMGLDKEPDVKAMVKWGTKETVANKYFELEIPSMISLSESVIDSIYRVHKDSLKLNRDRFKASHILLGDYESAMAVYDRLKKGSNFEELAKDYSIDRQSAKFGGDLGYFSADQVEPSFAEALKGLKENTFSKPVKTSYGYHIIKLTERASAGTSLDSLEARGLIEDRLRNAKQAESVKILIDSLKANSEIETFPLPEPEKRIMKDG